MVGPTGAGKSSLFNAIFDLPDFLPTGGEGDAVTSVPIEIHGAPEDLFEGYIRMELTYMKKEEFEEDVTTYLQWLKSFDDEDDLEGAAMDSSQNGPRARIRAVFPHLSDLQLRNMEVEQVVQTRRNVYDLLDTTVLCDYDDMERLSLDLKMSTSSAASKALVSRQHQSWPLLEVVKIYMHHKILEHGLIVADHPGVGKSIFSYPRARSIACDYLVSNASLQVIQTQLEWLGLCKVYRQVTPYAQLHLVSEPTPTIAIMTYSNQFILNDVTTKI